MSYPRETSGSQKLLAGVLLVAAVLVGGFFVLNAHDHDGRQGVAAADHRDAAYVIDGVRTRLDRGVSDTEAAPGSASRIVTRYFGSELKTDLDGDDREDVVFLLTQERGGSGTFFYAVAALSTDSGYVGSDGYLLGDRISPQTTEVSRNRRHKYVVVVNYADRGPGEPLTAQPSVGRSVYLKLDPASMRWAIVVPDFEGESR
ncbi:MAG: hypothetical protein ACYC6F_11490 [Longimicrobiales bacterium]